MLSANCHIEPLLETRRDTDIQTRTHTHAEIPVDSLQELTLMYSDFVRV